MTHSGPLVAGSSDLSLTCTVSEIIQGLTGLPSAVWLMADTTPPLTSGEGGITITETFINDTTVVSALSFSLLLTSHAGLYHCQVTIHSPAVASNITQQSSPVTLSVECKLHLTIIYAVYLSLSLSHTHTHSVFLSHVFAHSLSSANPYSGSDCPQWSIV